MLNKGWGDCCSVLVENLKFILGQARFWRWNLSRICVRALDMTSRSYSTLGSVVPLAMFVLCHQNMCLFWNVFFLYLYICICIVLCFQKLVVTMGTFPTRGRDIVPVFIHRARVFSFLLDILDISSSSIYLFINILKMICLLFICYLFVYNYLKLIFL